ncbi:hypothetical protein ACJZ2D_014942 [Fusarium nematophilum]
MLYLLTLVTLAFSATACAEIPRREAVDFTLQAGSLVGTGMIEFNSHHAHQTTGDGHPIATEMLEDSKTYCRPTTITQARTMITTPVSDDMASDPASGIVVSAQPNLSTPTSGSRPSNASFRFTSTPSITASTVSEATPLHQVVWMWLFSLGVMMLHVFVV